MMKQAGKRIGAVILVLVMIFAMQAPVSAKTHELGNSLTNQALGQTACEYGGRIYYGYGDKIFSVKKDGTGRKTVYMMEDAQGCNGFVQVIVHAGTIYAIFDFYGGSDASNCSLIRVNLDGSEYRNYGNAASVALVDGRLYYTRAVMRTTEDGYSSMESTGIYVRDLDGSNLKVLVKKSGVYLIAADGTAIYYRSVNAKTYKMEMFRCDMDGKNRKKLLAYDGTLNGFAVVGDDLYYGLENSRQIEDGTTEWSSVIYRKSMKDGSKQKIYTCGDSIVNFYVDGEKIYASAYRQGVIRINLSTGKSKVLNEHTGMGIAGVYGDVVILRQYRMDENNGTDIDLILAKASTGKKIKKIGAYFTS